MAEELSEHFNLLARAVDAAEINLEELRNSLQSDAWAYSPMTTNR